MEPRKIFLNLVFTTVLVYCLANFKVIPGMFVGSVYAAIFVAVLMALLNVTARMVLPFLHVPIILLAIWFSAVILNGASLIVLSKFMDHSQFAISGVDFGSITMEGFLTTSLAALLISAAQSISHKIFS